MNRRRKKKKRIILWMSVALIGTIACAIGYFKKSNDWKNPEELLVEYMKYIPEQEYEEMYAMLNKEAPGNISQEDFIKRNSAIYEGIEVRTMTVEVVSYDEEEKSVRYQTSMDTIAGNITFENEAIFLKGQNGYEMVWNDALIFPELYSTDKVRVSTIQANRGEIFDRNDLCLAGKGVASSVGIVPGKLEDRNSAIQKIAELLEMEQETIEKKLSAQWVKEDFFVPIKTIPKVEEIELMFLNPDENVLQENKRQKCGNIL